MGAEAAGSQIRAWMDEGIPPVSITVNLSSRQFQSNDLIDRISRTLRETRMPAASLEIEITEDAAMGNVEYTIGRLRQLTNLGVRVSLDNFGTGYTSLSQLRRLPLGKLKLDRSFVRDISEHADDRAIDRSCSAHGPFHEPEGGCRRSGRRTAAFLPFGSQVRRSARTTLQRAPASREVSGNWSWQEMRCGRAREV